MGQSVVSARSVVTVSPHGNVLGFGNVKNGRHEVYCLLITWLGKEGTKFLKNISL